ncbi:MAG: BTAD domain-containing putative transcriptional regulator, partial [Bacillota bacterium]
READELDLALRHLLHSAETSRRKGAKQVLAGTCLHLAELYSRRRQDSLADRHLSEALGLASRHRYRVFWDFHRPTLLRQCVRALERSIHPDYAEYLLSYWLGSQAADAVAIAADRVTGSRKRDLQAAASRLRSMVAPSSETGGAAWEPDVTPVAGSRPILEVKMFGSFEVSVKGVPIPEKAWQTRKVKALLKYLVVNRSRRVSREDLMELLWPDADPDSSAPSLRVTLSRLRRALGPEGAPFLGEERGFAWFEPALPYRLDVEDFEEAVSSGVEKLKGGDKTSAAQDLGRAIDLYRGDMLEEDLYEDWPAAERERLQIICLNALLSLARLTVEDGSPDYDRALALLNRALAVNPYREETYLALMQTHAAKGEVAESLRAYERCRMMLQDEFGVAPGREVEQFASRVKAAPR